MLQVHAGHKVYAWEHPSPRQVSDFYIDGVCDVNNHDRMHSLQNPECPKNGASTQCSRLFDAPLFALWMDELCRVQLGIQQLEGQE